MTLEFPGMPAPTIPEPPEPISDGVALTRRNEAKLARGVHPATLRALLEPRGPTCGTCVHHEVVNVGRAYHKCARHRLGMTASAASDIRLKWPACALYEPEPPPIPDPA